MDKDELAALDLAATLRKLIADTAADVSAQNTYWTAGTLADALIATGKLVLIDEGAVDVMAKGIRSVTGLSDCECKDAARAALSALGAK